MEASEFLKELEKARKKACKDLGISYQKLSLDDEARWLEYFMQKKAEALKAQISQTDNEIDRMVYALYGLTDEEIAVVEQSV